MPMSSTQITVIIVVCVVLFVMNRRPPAALTDDMIHDNLTPNFRNGKEILQYGETLYKNKQGQVDRPFDRLEHGHVFR
jgi:hypothetical protein